MDIRYADEDNEFDIVPAWLDVLYATTIVIYLVRPPGELHSQARPGLELSETSL